MRRSLIVIAFILFPILLNAQVQDTIYVWDNDRGKVEQRFPAVATTDACGFIAWQDGRVLDYDIWRSQRNWYFGLLSPDQWVSPDPTSNYVQTQVDCEGNPNTQVVYAWEDSLYTGTAIAPARIMAAIGSGSPFLVYSSTTSSQKNPAVSCANNGDFVVSFTSWTTGGISAIRQNRYASTGGTPLQHTVWGDDSLRRWPPVSRVAFCDSGIVTVYEDSTTTNSRSIFLHYCKRDGSSISTTERLKVTNPGNPSEAYNEISPAVAVNAYGYVVVTWEDYRVGSNPDIYYRPYQMRPGANTIIAYAEGNMTNISYPDLNPRIAVFPDSDFVIVWQQDRGTTTDIDIRGRVFYDGAFRTTFAVNVLDTLYNQVMPDVESRNSLGFYVAWMSYSPNSAYDIYCRSFVKVNLDYGAAPLFTPESLLTQDTVGGRKAWYFDDEDYDNPATPGWDEDPIAEPESIFVDLEFAIVDQIMELNTNNQYFVTCRDSLPRRQKGRAFDADAMFLDLGYRTPLASAGTISNTEKTTLVEFLEYYGQPVMVEGNDFGYLYDTTHLFSLFHTNYLGDGAPYASGNIDTLYGTSNTYSRGETLLYDYKSWPDNYPDSIGPVSPARLVLRSSGATDERWATGRSIGFENNWKDGIRIQGNTVYNSFMLSGVKSGDHPHTYAEYYRRMMGFLHLACQPEPITDLTSTTGSGEGTVNISWKIVSDDSLAESASSAYELKFARLKMGSEMAYEDSSEEYYQQWIAPGVPGTTVNRSLSGLPPMDTLIFALKVQDNEGLWNALGAEPRAVVSGDSFTPHSVTVGTNFVKDFANRWELFDVRLSDSLFMSWDQNNFYVGFGRCKFKTAGDLFVYVDTKSGGADSTVGWSAATGKSAFGVAFRPDYVYIFDDSTNYKFRKYSPTKDGRGSWVDTVDGGRLGADSIVNKYLYTEISIPFLNMRYDTLIGFKVMVLVQNEASNYIWNAFPPNNSVGGTGLFLPYYYFAANGLRSNLVPNHGLVYIGVEEEEGHSATASYLNITPNPFRGQTTINYSIGRGVERGELKIYDATGRLVNSFILSNTPSAIRWPGTDQNGRSVTAGVYFCALKVGDRIEMVKAVFVR
jgi:hypothetical protein